MATLTALSTCEAVSAVLLLRRVLVTWRRRLSRVSSVMRMDSTDSAAPTLISRTARWIDGGGTAAGRLAWSARTACCRTGGRVRVGGSGRYGTGHGELPTVEMIVADAARG